MKATNAKTRNKLIELAQTFRHETECDLNAWMQSGVDPESEYQSLVSGLYRDMRRWEPVQRGYHPAPEHGRLPWTAETNSDNVH